MDKTTNIYFPKWAVILYSALTVVLVPWIFNLAQNLPARHLVRYWDTVWVGFDFMMLVALGLTVWLLIKKRIWVVLSATVLATLFIVDAWFDIFTAKPGIEQRESLFFGVLEIALAILTYRLVYIIMARSNYNKRFRIIAKN